MATTSRWREGVIPELLPGISNGMGGEMSPGGSSNAAVPAVALTPGLLAGASVRKPVGLAQRTY
jgi:hypothetical protein